MPARGAWRPSSRVTWAAVRSVAFAPDGRRIASSSWDRTLRLGDVQTGREVRPFKGHTAAPDGIRFTPDGRHLLSSGGQDRSVRVWDVETGKEVRRTRGAQQSQDTTPTSHVLERLASCIGRAPFPGCIRSCIALQCPQGPLNLCRDTFAFLVDRHTVCG
jgi:WD40 repeat protein